MGVSQRIPKFFGALLAAQVLVACGGASVSSDSQTLSGVAPAAVPRLRLSWIDPRAKTGTLLYVSDSNAGTVFVYSYPQLVRVGELRAFQLPAGLCVNRRNGNVWVTDTYKRIVEYAHGGTTPIRSIRVSNVYVHACAVNPKTGDLAVVTSATDDPSVIQIFKPGSLIPTTYSDYKHAYSMWFDAYDPSGNLFVDANRYAGPGHFALEQLTKGSGQLTNVSWNGPKIRLPGGVQYDGTYLAIGDEQNDLIYRISNGSAAATVTLQGACLVQEFFIYNHMVIAPSSCGSNGDVLIYNYPAGGSPVKRLSGFQLPFGVVISR